MTDAPTPATDSVNDETPHPQLVIDAMLDSMDDETGAETVQVDGIVHAYLINKAKVETHEEEVRAWLAQMDPNFHRQTGGGWSFLNLCNTKDGVLWTGSHQTMEMLVCMGIALGLVRYSMPKELWAILPGGMPYIEIDLVDKFA